MKYSIIHFWSNHYAFVFDRQLTDRELARIQSTRHRPVEEQSVGNYKLIKTIGRGNFAKVKLAKHVPTGQQVQWTSSIELSFLSFNKYSPE